MKKVKVNKNLQAKFNYLNSQNTMIVNTAIFDLINI